MGSNVVDDAVAHPRRVLIPDRRCNAPKIAAEAVPETSQRSHRSAWTLDDGATPTTLRLAVRLKTNPG